MVEGMIGVAVVDEQEAANWLITFLVNDIGWVVAQDVTDVPTERDVVFQSNGEDGAPNPYPRYIRLRGVSNGLYLYTYETFTSVLDNTGEVSGYVTLEPDAQGLHMLVVADLERVIIHIQTYDSVKYMGYVGRIYSYYTVEQHKYPNLVKGCAASTNGWFENQAWAIGPTGVQQAYLAIEPASEGVLNIGVIGVRNGLVTLAAPVLAHDGIPGESELIGEPMGLFSLPGTFGHGQIISIFGRLYLTVSCDGRAFAVGPITALGVTTPPSLYTNLF